MTEKQVLEKLAIFKDALIKKNEKIKTLENGAFLLEEKIKEKSNLLEKTVQEKYELEKQNKELISKLEEASKNVLTVSCELGTAKENIEKLSQDKEKISFYETLLQEKDDRIADLELRTSQFSDDFTEADLENDKLKKEIGELKSEIETLKSNKKVHDKSLDVDDMMEKIQRTEPGTTEVDKTLDSIKNGEKLFKQYSFGVANKETLKLFKEFIEAIYEKAPLVGRYYILNSPSSIKQKFSRMSENTYETFVKTLKENGLEERENSGVVEYVSTKSENEMIEAITREC